MLIYSVYVLAVASVISAQQTTTSAVAAAAVNPSATSTAVAPVTTTVVAPVVTTAAAIVQTSSANGNVAATSAPVSPVASAATSASVPVSVQPTVFATATATATATAGGSGSTAFNPATACQGLADGAFACASSSQFTTCAAGVLQLAQVQACQPGLVCCQSTKRCEWPGTCPNAPSNWSPTTNSNNCQGAADYSFVCPNQSQYTYCLAGAPVLSQVSNCQLGLICCQSSRACVSQGQCNGPTVYPTQVFTTTSKGGPRRTYVHHKHKKFTAKIRHHHKHNPFKSPKTKKTTATATTMTTATTVSTKSA
ncbi:hypothetical protein HDU79_005914 [Rhizoclosmatium sp. JEL0117]|nr:hypothetical protein HDU79_005914 [Rhizoclosmatium sp. JEL0117]